MEEGNGTAIPPIDSRNSGLSRPRPASETGDRASDLLALSRVSAAVSGLSDLDAILQVALDNVLDIMKGTVGGILLFDEENKTLYYRVYRGLSPKFAQEVRLRLGEGIIGRVAQSGKSILSEDISVDPRAARPDMVRMEGLKAFICVPLRAKDAVLGVINVASHVPHRFTNDDMYLLHSIGDQVGIAIEQAKLYERLRKTTERYRQLARQILVVQEEEQKRLARELHDETSQALSGVSLQLQALIETAEMSGSQNAEFITRLKKVQSLAVHVHTEVSRLITNLHPGLLDTLGLVPAIHRHAESSLRPLGITVSVETKGGDRRLPPEVEATLFRFVQGAIGNIVQHSRAKNAAIVLEYQDDEFLLQISDDGQGFDVSKITNIEESGRGRGVFSMKERIRLLGGTCRIDSQLGQGTTVRAVVPMSWIGSDAENKGTGSR
jgi:signal transduction histidine kinase